MWNFTGVENEYLSQKVRVTQEIGNLAPIKVPGNIDGLVFFPSNDMLQKSKFSNFNYYAVYAVVIPRVPVERWPHY